MQRLAFHPTAPAAIAAELKALPPLQHQLEMIRAEEELKAAKTELMEQLDECVPPEMQYIVDYSLCKNPVFTPQGVAHNLTTLNAHWHAETKINAQRIRDRKDVQSTTCPRTRIPLQRDELITSGAEYDALSAIFTHANNVRDSLILQINTMQAVSLKSSLKIKIEAFRKLLDESVVEIKKISESLIRIHFKKMCRLNLTSSDLDYWSKQRQPSKCPLALDPRLRNVRLDNADHHIPKEVAVIMTAADKQVKTKAEYVRDIERARDEQLQPGCCAKLLCCFNFTLKPAVTELLQVDLTEKLLFQKRKK